MPPGSQFNVVASVLDDEEFNVPWENYIPYDGTGAISQALASGEVPVGILTLSTASDQAENVDVFAGLVDEQLEPFPEADIIPELGYPSLDWLGKITRVTYAPPDTPDDRIDWLESASEEAITSDELQSWADGGGIPLNYKGGSDYVEQLTEDAISRIQENVDLEQFR
jgi:tripartite-type tricarboxylate transporter receptor subunit TctC